jgi:hypothetical protein
MTIEDLIALSSSSVVFQVSNYRKDNSKRQQTLSDAFNGLAVGQEAFLKRSGEEMAARRVQLHGEFTFQNDQTPCIRSVFYLWNFRSLERKVKQFVGIQLDFSALFCESYEVNL